MSEKYHYTDLQFQVYLINGELFGLGYEPYSFEHENYFPDLDENILRTLNNDIIRYISDLEKLID